MTTSDAAYLRLHRAGWSIGDAVDAVRRTQRASARLARAVANLTMVAGSGTVFGACVLV